MNKVILMGRLCADPEVKYTQGGKCVTKYRLAVDREFKKDGQKEADFINCVAFDKRGEFAANYLTKGMKIAIEGRIQTGSYEKDGVKHYTTDIIVDKHEFCESKSNSSVASGATYSAPMPEQDFSQIEVDDDELPF